MRVLKFQLLFALLLSLVGACARVDVGLDGGVACRTNAQCPEGLVCARSRCVPVDAAPAEDGGDGQTQDASVFVPEDAGLDAGVEDEDAGFEGNCDDPFDAGPGPFTFDTVDAGKPDGSVPIYWIQDPDAGPRPDAGSNVWLYGVVSTTPRTLISGFDGGLCTYGAWVSEPQGGPGSGILLVDYAFLPADSGIISDGDNCPDGGSIPGDLQVGEALSIRGKYTEFCIGCAGENVAEIRVSGFDRLGTLPVPPPVIVSGADIGLSPTPGSDKERKNRLLEGTLLQLRDTRVTSENADAPRFYRTWQVTGETVTDAGVFVSLGGGEETSFVHNTFDFRYRPRLNHRFKCITGPLTFSFGRYKLEPRTDADLVRRR